MHSHYNFGLNNLKAFYGSLRSEYAIYATVLQIYS